MATELKSIGQQGWRRPNWCQFRLQCYTKNTGLPCRPFWQTTFNGLYHSSGTAFHFILPSLCLSIFCRRVNFNGFGIKHHYACVEYIWDVSQSICAILNFEAKISWLGCGIQRSCHCDITAFLCFPWLGLLVCTQATPILNFLKYVDSKNWLDFHSKCLKFVYDVAKQLLFSRIQEFLLTIKFHTNVLKLELNYCAKVLNCT